LAEALSRRHKDSQRRRQPQADSAPGAEEPAVLNRRAQELLPVQLQRRRKIRVTMAMSLSRVLSVRVAVV
jgi:hypothetical protein